MVHERNRLRLVAGGLSFATALHDLGFGQAAVGSFGALIDTVDNFVAQLRSKLERDPEAPRHLVTVRGSGYRFDP